MSNKKIFNEIYSNKINKEKNWNEIINRIEKKHSKKNILKKSIIPICAPLVIILLISINLNNNDKISNINTPLYNTSKDYNTTQKDENINNYSNGNESNLENKEEKFMIGTTLDDGRLIHFTFDVPYNSDSLNQALTSKKISLNEFIHQLNYQGMLNDGGSKLYKYNKNQNTFGNEDFYVMVCNSIDNINDIYIAKKIESLNDKCHLKINDLPGVKMTIKKGTLTKTSATVIITDTSNRENIYGTPYRIDKLENNIWKPLDIIYEGNYAWTSIGYTVGDDHKLEFNINWKKLYGELKKGKYRIVKDTSIAGEGTTHYITTEFSIQ